jgi:cell division protein FtsB
MSRQMLEKIKNRLHHSFLQNFRDVRFVGFVAFGVIVLLASWSGVRVIEQNYALQKQITQLGEQNKVSQLQNTNLQLKNEYYNTNTYLELTARKQFGKGAPGEKLLLVPKDVALAHAKELPDEHTKTNANTSSHNKSKTRQNVDAWMSFFFRKAS